MIIIHYYYYLSLFMGRARAWPHPMCWALSEGPSADGRPGPSDGRPPCPPHMGRARARARPMDHNR